MSELARIVKLAELLVWQQEKLKEAEQEVKNRKADMLRTEREDLPELMKELGLTEIKLADGSVVTIKEEVSTNISKENPWPALSWLIKNNFGGLIKTEISIAFGKGEHDEATLATNALKELGYAPNLKEAVHPQTLKSFVKEQMKAGQKIPLDLFNIYPYSIATIKRSKK